MTHAAPHDLVLEIRSPATRGMLGAYLGMALVVVAILVIDRRPWKLVFPSVLGILLAIPVGIAVRLLYGRWRPSSYSLILTRDHLLGPPDSNGERMRVPLPGLPLAVLDPPSPFAFVLQPTVRLLSPSGAAMAFRADLFSRRQLRQLVQAIRAIQAAA